MGLGNVQNIFQQNLIRICFYSRPLGRYQTKRKFVNEHGDEYNVSDVLFNVIIFT